VAGDRLPGVIARKEPRARSLGAPPVAQRGEQRGREHDAAVALALLIHVDFFLVPSTKTAIISPVLSGARPRHDARRLLIAGVTFTRERQTSGNRADAIVLNGRQIIVGRAMYSNAGGLFWAAGSNTLATRLTP
jgi:hypothetical protein